MQLDDEVMEHLGSFIKRNDAIERVELEGNKVTDKGIEILAPYLEGNKTFRILSLHGNSGITDKCVHLLGKMIQSSHIKEIDIKGTSITQKNALVVPLACNKINHGSIMLELIAKFVYF